MKRLRHLIWFLLGAGVFLSVLCFWHWNDKRKAVKTTAGTSKTLSAVRPASTNHETIVSASTAPLALLSRAKSTNTVATSASVRNARLKYRLSNTSRTVGELARSDQAILLGNALVDTTRPLNFSIPDNLRAQGDPGSYIVQAHGPIDDAFRAELKAAGAEVISYVPNNAYLVRASANIAQELSANPQTQTVLPYEPYYKLSSSLLAVVVEQQTLPGDAMLNVVVFPDAEGTTRTALQTIGADIVARNTSPFGPVLTVIPRPDSLPVIAGLPGVEMVQASSKRKPANDLSRARVAVAADSITQSNYLSLSGSNVLVQVNDSGVDATHPDLFPRVTGNPLTDTDGHGTHVAGIIAGSGLESLTVSNAIGSIMPGTNAQFRGMAPAASLYVQSLNNSDFTLQETAAQNNAPISNNSWNYDDNTYDIFAASYDAAVRDALPFVTGPQPVLFVFSAGNVGDGTDDGFNGVPDTILSPATAKNVITVGAIEQLRNITNDVVIDGVTNEFWADMTSSSNEVASFSSRGNVGIGIEGDFGRFKPDVVAPGVFVVSTRSEQWDTNAYYNPTNYDFNFIPQQLVDPATLHNYSIFVPSNTVQLIIEVFASNTNFNNLPIYVSSTGFPTTNSFGATNVISLPPDFPLINGTTWHYSVGNPYNQRVQYEVVTELVVTNENGDELQVLSQLNDSIGTPSWYRYESGTSMAAADVSGVLALIQDFFTNTLNTLPSPALKKAILINGARTVNAIYDLQVQNSINFQGWGLINLPNSIPFSLVQSNSAAAIPGVLTNGPSPVLLYDQNPLSALATGDRRTLFVSLDPAAQNQPLRATLAWTDPPGNPVAGVKLVNDLDLIVTNLDTGDVYFGNDIPSGGQFSSAWNTNDTPNIDFVNNVENVYLNFPLSTNYSITVVGHRVNVNAVSTNPNEVAQDYALVVSSDSQLANAITIASAPAGGLASVNSPFITQLTNQFAGNPDISGQLLLGQHVGASSPLQGNNVVPLGTNTIWGTNGAITLGVTNQWHFYIVTNLSNNFTNAAFATFLPLNLAPSRMGVTNVDDPNNPTNATRPEADIDLYVSTDAGLTNLDPAVIANSVKSLTRGGTELIVLTNATSGLYYVGVKSEDQEAAEYAFLGLFSDQPFSTLQNGVEILHGLNVPTLIPDGSPAHPGVAQVVAIGVQPLVVRRVVVTNTISHQDFGDLIGSLSHNHQFAVLNNHTFGNSALTQTHIYEDAGENDIPGAQHSDGPGSLNNFMGEQGAGLWLFTVADNALTHTGQVDSLIIRLDPEIGGGGTNTITIEPDSFGYFTIDVPVQATNLVISVLNISGAPLPIQLYLRRGDLPTQTVFDYTQTINPPGGALSVSTASLPPLQPGRYYLGLFNPNLIPQTLEVSWLLFLNPNPIAPITFTSGGPAPILDDAVTYSSITITNFPDTVTIAEAAVAVAINHPRVSDLVLTLISPTGERFLLFENRGGPNTANLGSDIVTTNFFGTQIAGGAIATTNVIGPIPPSGTLLINYDFFTAPDSMDVYYDGGNIFSTGGFINGSGTFSIPYGPGNGNSITIIVNQNGNPTNSTQWIYTPYVISDTPSYFTFTDDTNQTQVPIKYEIPPFNDTASATSLILSTFNNPPVVAGEYVAPMTVDSWGVLSNQVSVVNDPATATDGQFLALASGVISNNLTVVPGSQYNLSYLYRGPGAVSDWPADGNAFDVIGSNNGTISGTVTYGPGFVGTGAFTVGAALGSAVLLGDPISLRLTNAFTIEGWVFATGYPGGVNHAQIVFRGDARPALDPYYFSVEPLGALRLHIENNAGTPTDLQTATGVIAQNQWVHVAGSFDGNSGQMSLYVNGTLAATVVTAVKPFGDLDPTQNPGIAIGNVSQPGGGQNFIGSIDDLAIYSRALSPSEIRAIYSLGSAGKMDNNSSVTPAQGLAKAQVTLGGIRTDTIYGNNTNWQIWNTSFTPGTTTVPLTVTGLEPGMLLDTFTLNEVPGPVFVLPEETLHDLIGQSPNGTWTLEIQDDRAGDPIGELINWQLQFILTTNISGTINLTNGVTSTNVIPACDFQYYVVQVPSWANFVTNILVSAPAPVTVWFNQTMKPTGTNVDDIPLIPGATSGSFTLSSNSVPPLVPGATYYLGVENPCVNGSNVAVNVQVDFGIDVIRLTNMVPYANTNSGTNFTYDYYVFNVPTNAARAQFEIDNPSSYMELVARKGLPPPNPSSFDYLSDNPGTNDELIVVFTNSAPVPLSAGDWYLTAVNLSSAPVNYSIMASWWPTTGQPVTITNVTVSSNSLCITWTSLPGVHYFIQGVTNLGSGMVWTNIVPDILGASNSTTTTYCIPLPSPYHFFRVGEGLILSFPTLGSGTTITNVIPPCQTAYFTVTVPPLATFVANTLLSASAPVNVWFNQNGAPRAGNSFGDYELITNSTAGSFTLTTNSTPPLVPGATYYLGVENPCVNGSNVTVVLQVDFGLGIITLTNMIPYANSNSGAIDANDYYVFNVPTNAARAQFEIDNPSGYVPLLVSPGTPPNLFSYDFISANPGTNDQLIVVFTNSAPVPLSAGNWYLTAVNLSGGPVSYSIMASWWPTTGQPITITGVGATAGNVCITWTSLLDVHYYIEGVPALTSGMTWTPVSPDIIGTGNNTTYCIPLPSSYHFFRVVEGLAASIALGPPPAVTIRPAAGGFLLQWTGPITAKYQVEWSPSLSPPVWTPVGGILTSITGQFSFLDDGSLTGGLGGMRYYNVVQVP